jgi:short-subunit dehydrogenase
MECLLITGASAGLGEEFASQLAARCKKMVLVARRGDRLASIAASLTQRHDIEVFSYEADLCNASARLQLHAALQEKAWQPDGLINNAGMGDYGTFHEASWEKTETMIRLNMEALTHLTHLFLPPMIAAGTGQIINISSLASILPIPDFAVYAATKAYVSSFSEALRIELKEFGINVLAVCPGPIKTEFGQVAARNGKAQAPGVREWFFVSKEQAVAETIQAMESKVARLYPGWKVCLAAAGISLIPLAVLRMLMATRPRKV